MRHLAFCLVVALYPLKGFAEPHNIVTNGDFEQGQGSFALPGDQNYQVFAPGYVGTIIYPGSVTLLGWNVAISPFDPDQTLSLVAPQGLEWTHDILQNNHLIDLNRSGDLWSISQQISTIVGQQYQLSYEAQLGSVMGGATVQFSLGGNSTQIFESTSSIIDSPVWGNHSHMFIADASTTLLTVTAKGVGLDPYSGPQLDNIKIVAIPEPATFALLMFVVMGSASFRVSENRG